MLAVLLVLGTTLGARSLVLRAQRPPMVAAPGVPPLAVVAVVRPAPMLERVAVDARAGHLLALTLPAEPRCPPIAGCEAAPAPNALVVLDGATGATLHTTPLDGTVPPGAPLVVDASSARAYVVAGSVLRSYSTVSGEALGSVPLPPEAAAPVGAALAPGGGALYLVTPTRVLLVDAASGALRAQQPLTGTVVDGPLVDGARAQVVLLEAGAGAPSLVTLDGGSLRPVRQEALAPGTRLGPISADGAALFLFAPDGTTLRLPLDATGARAPVAVPAMRGARALGWAGNPAANVFAADAQALHLRAGALVLGQLPVAAVWPGAEALPTDAARGLLYLPLGHGELALVRTAAPTAAALTPATALLLARAAMDHFIRSSPQNPPFATGRAFPAGVPALGQAATRSTEFYVTYAGRGWDPAYPGSTSTLLTAAPGPSGGYEATFTLRWTHLFARSHTWVTAVAPDGAVRLVQQSGDALP